MLAVPLHEVRIAPADASSSPWRKPVHLHDGVDNGDSDGFFVVAVAEPKKEAFFDS